MSIHGTKLEKKIKHIIRIIPKFEELMTLENHNNTGN